MDNKGQSSVGNQWCKAIKRCSNFRHFLPCRDFQLQTFMSEREVLKFLLNIYESLDGNTGAIISFDGNSSTAS